MLGFIAYVLFLGTFLGMAVGLYHALKAATLI